MNVTEAYQIVCDPEEEAVMRPILEALDAEEPYMSWRAHFKILMGGWIHPLGIHTWVRHRRHDATSNRIIDVGLVCWYCELGRTA